MNNWSAVAFNTAPDSENRIHGDDLAKEYGFEGGLLLTRPNVFGHMGPKNSVLFYNRKNQNVDLVSLTSDWMIQKDIF